MTHRCPLFITCLLIVLPLWGCAHQSTNNPASAPKPSERVAMLMGGWPHANAITQTGKATAFRINYDADGEEQLGPPVPLTPEQREILVSLIARNDAYEWTIAKGCEPRPGVLVSFEDGATYARLRICYECRMLGFKPGAWEDFDPISDELVAWVKAVFPDDKAIQDL